MRRKKAAARALTALVVTVTVVLVCAFTPPGAGRHGRGAAPRDGARHGVPAGGYTLVAGAAIVAGGAALGLLGLVCNRPRQRVG
ncbi:hypothetical protein [Streptomyces roseoverticillatus]|uniref:Secreted protein n=1 Tax=Streptomyces roseoverticillatus TaxID=66429 RepID=A0ABV3IZS3_9ACTN